ncbi:MAG: ATPase [Tissierellia bacterium]|nr:ATPase [Tissierellia bacterium]
MAKEAIQAVKTAEEQAKEILQQANQRSIDSKKEATKIAEEKYQAILKEARDEGEKIKEKALSEGESISEPIIAKGMEEAKKIAAMTDKDLDSAVNIIIERIVNADGNS